ncbi:response regulator transcription factor [Microbispora sp. KK1-11]|nr:response regulator transcription factor [Microbispora sp. KK1-11]
MAQAEPPARGSRRGPLSGFPPPRGALRVSWRRKTAQHTARAAANAGSQARRAAIQPGSPATVCRPGSAPPAASAGHRAHRAGGGAEVLTLVGRDLSNAEIAAELFVSAATVKTYVTRLLAKLGARDRVRLVLIVYETGLVSPTG